MQSIYISNNIVSKAVPLCVDVLWVGFYIVVFGELFLKAINNSIYFMQIYKLAAPIETYAHTCAQNIR